MSFREIILPLGCIWTVKSGAHNPTTQPSPHAATRQGLNGRHRQRLAPGLSGHTWHVMGNQPMSLYADTRAKTMGRDTSQGSFSPWSLNECVCVECVECVEFHFMTETYEAKETNLSPPLACRGCTPFVSVGCVLEWAYYSC